MKTTTNNRRTFLGKCLFGAGTLIGFGNSKRVSNYSGVSLDDEAVFACESGNLGKSDCFTLGMLQVPNVREFETEVNKLRSAYRYYIRLSYSDNNYYKVAFAKTLISWLFERTDAVLYVLHDKEKIYSSNPDYPNAPSFWQILMKKRALYGKLAEEIEINDCPIYVKYQTPMGPSVAYAQQFYTATSCQYLALDTRQSNALQISGLLTGSIAAVCQQKRVHPVKQEIIDYLKITLGNEPNQRGFTRHKQLFIYK